MEKTQNLIKWIDLFLLLCRNGLKLICNQFVVDISNFDSELSKRNCVEVVVKSQTYRCKQQI